MRRRFVWWAFLSAALVVACEDDPQTTSPQDTSADTGVLDTGVTDTAADAAETDATGGCTSNEACESGLCLLATGVCAEPTCEDGIANGEETDADCGGLTCDACENGQACNNGDDCASGNCTAAACAAPVCTDGARNGAETDTDCGGDTCDPCAEGRACQSGTDCESGTCQDGVCLAGDCDDGVSNGDETGVDCGGPDCEPCGSGEACGRAGDCESTSCVDDICAEASCEDGILNGEESFIDCGGSDCDACSDGDACQANRDCLSRLCDPSSRTCISASCGDETRNGEESFIDCGGSQCAPCETGQTCNSGADCASGVCDTVCLDPACNDNTLNGDESGVDCGGPTCAPCPIDESCDLTDDCEDPLICRSNVCERPRECYDLYVQRGVTADGAYTIDPDGNAGEAPFEAYCDMTSEGGGWTMLLKGTGDCTFDYESEYWTTANVLNETALTLDAGNAKYPAFNALELTELWAQWPDIPHAMTASWTGALTALDRFQTEADLGMSAGQHSSAWPTQSGYQQYGFNLTCAESASVRWGWAFNNETDCASNDTGSGIGLNCVSGDRNTDMGAWLTCCPADSSFALGNYPDRVRLYGRGADPCANGVQDAGESDVDCGGSCDAICDIGQGCAGNEECTTGVCQSGVCEAATACLGVLEAGTTTDGVYTLDPDGAGGVDPFDALCDLSGGGWTLLMKSTGDCTFAYDAPVWTTSNVVEEADLTLADANAKYPAFNSVGVTELRADWPSLSHTMTASWTGALTALDRFQTSLDLTGGQLYSGWPIQSGYQQYGFNVDCGPSWGRVRWGWQMNNETTCSSNDTGAGIGLACEGANRQAACGAFVTCCPVNAVAIGDYPSPVRIWGR